MKKFINKILRLCPLVTLLIVINILIDPSHQLNYSYEKKMAENLSAGTYIEIYNFDERIMQKYYICAQKQAKNTVILGSSRTMQIGEKVLMQENVFNSSVSGATLEDYIAIYQLYKDNDIFPNNIIIGVDPWIFNKNNSELRWKSIREYYYIFFENKEDISVNKTFDYEKLKLYISFSYFQESVDKIFDGNKEQNEGNIKLPDGSIIYNSTFSEANVVEINERAEAYILADNLNGLSNFFDIDFDYIRIFEKFVQDMRQDGVNISFFLAPYHPTVYKYISDEEKYSNVLEVEDYLRNFADKNNIEILGSYNPDNPIQGYKISEDGFYDGLHPKQSSIEIIFQNKTR